MHSFSLARQLPLQSETSSTLVRVPTSKQQVLQRPKASERPLLLPELQPCSTRSSTRGRSRASSRRGATPILFLPTLRGRSPLPSTPSVNPTLQYRTPTPSHPHPPLRPNLPHRFLSPPTPSTSLSLHRLLIHPPPCRLLPPRSPPTVKAKLEPLPPRPSTNLLPNSSRRRRKDNSNFPRSSLRLNLLTLPPPLLQPNPRRSDRRTLVETGMKVDCRSE